MLGWLRDLALLPLLLAALLAGGLLTAVLVPAWLVWAAFAEDRRGRPKE